MYFILQVAVFIQWAILNKNQHHEPNNSFKLIYILLMIAFSPLSLWSAWENEAFCLYTFNLYTFNPNQINQSNT